MQYHFRMQDLNNGILVSLKKIESSCGAVDFTLLEKIDKNEVQL